MNLLKKLIVPAIAIAITSGCATAPSQLAHLESSGRLYQVGVATKGDFIDQFGVPQEWHSNEDGTLSYHYEKREEFAQHWYNYIPISMVLISFDTTEEVVTADFLFDADGKLMSSYVYEETIDHDYGLFNRRFYPSNMEM